MGRLDDAAKRKVVELRQAGLSFRKIKAVLELENIKVSAQAIYLFLKEFQGRARAGDGPVGGAAGGSRDGDGGAGRNASWRDHQLKTLLREASRVAGYGTSETTGALSEGTALMGIPGVTGGLGRHEEEDKRTDEAEEEDVRIVSVMSLAPGVQGTQQAVGVQRGGAGMTPGAVAGGFIRRRLTPSPATNPVLVARKRLLDKALQHRARIRESAPSPGQQMASVLRRDQPWRQVTSSQPTSSIDLTGIRPPQARAMDGQLSGSLARRTFQQRAAGPVRNVNPTARVGIRLPSPTAPSSTATAQGSSPTPLQAGPPGAQQMREPSPPFLPAALGEQLQALGTEMRSLGLAVRMLLEQQCRLEREQTQVQKQILGTLQDLASSVRAATARTPPASYSSPQGGGGQPRFAEMNGSGFEGLEVFPLPGLDPGGVNGLGSSESIHLSHTHTPPTYMPPHSQSQPHTVLHSEPHTEAFMERKLVEFQAGGIDRAPLNCSSSAPTLSSSEPQLNIIKVESV
ncbi:uncharacterized protein LOC114794769 [Denticeps clupeoides]|uniref:uncharacterized protein LOC114794769 n=1 Tax=Denticeps clupeoides TaxID=299321 RepID=UPI0010A40B20|nr:uncharacterized protein LOC114794769 [Denticeps clupeoides]